MLFKYQSSYSSVARRKLHMAVVPVSRYTLIMIPNLVRSGSATRDHDSMTNILLGHGIGTTLGLPGFHPNNVLQKALRHFVVFNQPASDQRVFQCAPNRQRHPTRVATNHNKRIHP